MTVHMMLTGLRTTVDYDERLNGRQNIKQRLVQRYRTARAKVF